MCLSRNDNDPSTASGEILYIQVMDVEVMRTRFLDSARNDNGVLTPAQDDRKEDYLNRFKILDTEPAISVAFEMAVWPFATASDAF